MLILKSYKHTCLVVYFECWNSNKRNLWYSVDIKRIVQNPISHSKNHPSPELAPVTMTTVFRGSSTTGILGLDPITDFPDYWTVLDFPDYWTVLDFPNCDPIVNKFIQREYSYPHSDTIQLNSNVSSDPTEWETRIKLVLSGSCIEKKSETQWNLRAFHTGFR